MGLKCCVTGCASNYAELKTHPPSSKERKSNESDILPANKRRKVNSTHVPVFTLPTKESERDAWLKNIPRENIKITKWTAVCFRHWPPDFKRKPCQGGGVRPIEPPTIFENCGISPSQIPTPCPPPRPTKMSSSAARNVEQDQLNDHRELMKVDFNNIIGTIHQHINGPEILCYIHDNVVYIQSVEFSAAGVHKFLVKIFGDLRYESYHSGVRCYIDTIRIRRLNDWGKIIELIRFLNSRETPHKVQVLCEQIESLSSVNTVGKKVYELETVLRAFEYFAISRALYKQFANDYQLPSVSMLTKITSKSASVSDLDFIDKVFRNLDAKQRQCLILVDEISVKPQLLYHGGQLFGRAENDPNSLANSVLAIMVYCLFGGPKFIVKLIPVNKLTAEYQYDLVKKIIVAISKSGGKTVAVITDDNKVNQKFMKLFPTQPDTPWVTCESPDIPDCIFLLFDFVHIFKTIRNNWYTEKCQEICYQFPGMENSAIAKWKDLLRLFHLDEKNPVVKYAHKLTAVAVSSKPIERQNVSTMLKVFSDETIAALRAHPTFKSEAYDVEPTAAFLQLWVDVWTILNVRQPYSAIRMRDPRREEFRNTHDVRLEKLEDTAKMVDLMNCKNGKFPKKIEKYSLQLFFGNLINNFLTKQNRKSTFVFIPTIFQL